LQISIQDRTENSYFQNKLSTKADGTKEGIKYSLQNFNDFCITQNSSMEKVIVSIKDLDADHKEEFLSDLLQKWVVWNHKNNMAPGTIKRYFSGLSRYLSYRRVKMVNEIRENIDFPHPIREEPFPLQLKHVQQIFEVCSFRKKSLYLALLSSGMRIGEATSLRKKHAEKVFSNGKMRIKLNIPAKFTKNKTGRGVFISLEAWKCLKKRYESLDDEALIWGVNEKRKNAITAEEKALHRYLEKQNLNFYYESVNRRKINLHSFRSFFFTKAARIDVDFAQFMTGHTGYLIKEYDRLSEEEKLEIYLKIEPTLTISDDERIRHENMKLRKEKEKFEKIDLEQMHQEYLESKKNTIKINEFFEIRADQNPQSRKKRHEEFCKKYGFHKDIPITLKLQTRKEKGRGI